MKFILILFVYAGALSDHEAVALTSVPGFVTEQACNTAGQKATDLTKRTTKDARFVCVREG